MFFTSTNLNTCHTLNEAVEAELKFQASDRAPGISNFWLQFQHLEVFGSVSRMIWSIENH